ncbi:YciI family protein [Planctomicrobium sp. SH668]|uniref:YciI family protein n=1 Tax=Planctomicrobium sp. SH668 TaxID=3448126 RepID=UPI003F5B9314
MKFICLGYFDEVSWNTIPADEQLGMMEKCIDYDAELVSRGYMVGGAALQPAETAVTIQPKNGQIVVTDGPFIETKEYLGGILMLEARDLNHAIQLMSQHPGCRMGGFEIRAVNEEVMQWAKNRHAELGPVLLDWNRRSSSADA